MVGTRHRGFVTLQFDVIIIAERLLPPCHSFFGFFNLSGCYEAGNFAAKACRANYQPLAMCRDFMFVGAWAAVESFRPCT